MGKIFSAVCQKSAAMRQMGEEMTLVDKEKIKRLEETFDLNYKITALYANYLNIYPEIITEEMMDELCTGTDITKKEALVALLSELFGLDDANGGIERRLIRDYITPSVRLLDINKYVENPYYKNIDIEEVRDGSWEIKWEYYPPYRAAISDDLIIKDDFVEIPPLGFFTEGFRFPAVLEDGNEWMTLTPVDVDTCDEAIAKAHGKVVTFGLGLGYYTYMVSEKPEVSSITVVEKSPAVIKLFKKYILPKFSHPEKVKIVECDAIEYAKLVMPVENYDYAFVDIWRDASDGAPFYKSFKKLEANSPKTEFGYWIENFLISQWRKERFLDLMDAYEKNLPTAPKDYNEFIRRLRG